MEKEKRRENKQSRISENFGKKWKLLASVWVLMLAFLLVPGMKSEAGGENKDFRTEEREDVLYNR